MRTRLIRTSLLTPILLALLFVAGGQAFSQQIDTISNVTVAADNYNYLGPCPAAFQLTGKLQANDASSVLHYQFVHSDGSAGELLPLTIDHKGGYTVYATVRQHLSWSDEVFLRVFVPVPTGAPKEYDSNRIIVKGQCQEVQAAPRQVSLSLPPASGRFRVTLTGFVVNNATTENVLSTDGAGDEVFVLVNFAELWSSNNIFGALQQRQSLIYGDTSGHSLATAITGTPLTHAPGQPTVIKAGHASGSGGLVGRDRVGTGGELPPIPTNANAATRARLIPMILWEGELRRGGPQPNAMLIIPTIWENDNVPEVLNIWNRQVGNWIRHFATNSAGFINGTSTRQLIEQVDTVLRTVPQRNDFDRPIGMDGDAFNPLAATPNPSTFIPAVMLLTFNSAEAAANSTTQGRGVVEITYRDGQSYGPGSYTIFLLVERLP
jgi:hypothetical protein